VQVVLYLTALEAPLVWFELHGLQKGPRFSEHCISSSQPPFGPLCPGFCLCLSRGACLDVQIKMEGRSASHKGILQVAVEVFEMAPGLHMVEVRKAGGDTLEYHKVGCHADWPPSRGPLSWMFVAGLGLAVCPAFGMLLTFEMVADGLW
jgi:hypothetical protein